MRIKRIKPWVIVLVAAATSLVGLISWAAAPSSIITEHPTDVVNVLIWAVLAVGGAFIALLSFVVMTQYSDIKAAIRALDTDVKHRMTQLELRVHANEIDIANTKTTLRMYERRREDE